MKKIAGFIVEKRYAVLAVTLVLAIVCLFLTPLVEINSDMTKYLPDDSPMKNGIDLMGEEFEGMQTPNRIRVMAEGLNEEEKMQLRDRLAALEYVDSVDFKPDSEDYNRENYTLFVINTSYPYGSDEELSIEAALEEDFSEYSIVFKNGDTVSTLIPTWILVLAVVVATAILCAMSYSWVEPFLFLIAIGIAVFLNMGTNLIQGSVSIMTYTISAVLQLALSMDYSIILMSRYRQERAEFADKKEAMKVALGKSVPAVASSSLTTVVGLLALVFMRFKVGLDLGVVLAKGVFLSMLCVFTVLPGLILMGDKWIRRTEKKTIHVRLGGLATFSSRFRYWIAGAFVLMFAGFYLLQTQTGIAYSLETVDPIAEIFPTENPIVMLYDNDDEEAATELAEKISKEEKIREVLSYGTTLGKPYSAAGLAEALGEMGGTEAGALDPELLQTVYYLYYGGNAEKAVPLRELLQFLSEHVADSELLSGYLDGESAALLNQAGKFADPDALTQPRGATEMAEFLGYDAALIQTLYRIAGAESGTVETGTMTLTEFVAAVQTLTEQYPEVSAVLGSEMQAQLARLSLFADPDALTAPVKYPTAAERLGIEPEMMRMVYVLYYAQSAGYTPQSISLPELVRFLQEDVLTNPQFSGAIDTANAAQLNQLKQFTDVGVITKPMHSNEMAALLGMDAESVSMIYSLYYGREGIDSKTMRLPEFTGYLTGELLHEEAFAGMIDAEAAAQLGQLHTIVTESEKGTRFNAAQLAELSGMEESTIRLLFVYAGIRNGTVITAMTLPDFFATALSLSESPVFSGQFDAETLAQLQQINRMAQAAANRQTFTAAQLSTLLGVEPELAKTVYQLYFGAQVANPTVTPEQLVAYLNGELAANPLFASVLDGETAAQLKTLQSLMQGAVAGTKYSAAQLAQITGMDAQTLRLLLTYHDAEQGKAEGWTLSLQTAVNFLAENRDLLKTGIDADELEQLLLAKELVNAAVNGTEYSAEELAALVGTDAQQLNLLYALSSEDGADSGVKMSVQEFVEYLNTEILGNPAFSGMLDDAMTDALRTVQTMVEAVLNGTAYTPGELAALLGGIPLGETDASPDENMVSLLYLYRAGVTESDPEWTMTIEQLVDYLTGELAQDDRFSDLLGEEFQSGLDEMSAQLKDGVSQMVGPNYSLLMIDTVLPVEGKETEEFFARLNGICGETFTREYYLIGNSPMSEEMRLSFGREMWTITILTAAAIFLVVLLTFRSVLVAALLVLIVQCGVYITIATVGFQGYDIYFMATIVVQCILMGATVDYGILFTNYFRDCRRTMSVRDALANAYDGSIHTVLTSGTILVSTTGIISLCFQEPTIRQICQTISIGALCATLLILFILPGLLATFSRTKKPDAK